MPERHNRALRRGRAIASTLSLPSAPPFHCLRVEYHAYVAAILHRAILRRAAAATASAVIPNSRYSVSAGADAPKPVMPTNSPVSPIQRAQSPSTAASTPILGTDPSTAARYSGGC